MNCSPAALYHAEGCNAIALFHPSRARILYSHNRRSAAPTKSWTVRAFRLHSCSTREQDSLAADPCNERDKIERSTQTTSQFLVEQG